MSLPALDNLVRIGQLKSEPRLQRSPCGGVGSPSLAWLSKREPIHLFQCLTHTLNWPAPRWRVLDAAHQKRNLAEYEGFLEVEESSIAKLCGLVSQLIGDAEKLVR